MRGKRQEGGDAGKAFTDPRTGTRIFELEMKLFGGSLRSFNQEGLSMEAAMKLRLGFSAGFIGCSGDGNGGIGR